MTAAEKRRRLFFALWPDDETRRQLAQAAHQWARHPVANANLHMTLLFLGGCNDEQQQCYIEAASKVACEQFELELDYLGGWRRAGIQWLGTSHPPKPLDDLVEALTAALEPCGYRPEKRRFVPHITLSRKVKNPRIQAGLTPLRWTIGEFVLAESLPVERGVRYTVRERWALNDA